MNRRTWEAFPPTRVADVDGAAQLFLEAGIQFDIVDAEAESFDSYKALVLPDETRIDPGLRDKLESFLSAGASSS